MVEGRPADWLMVPQALWLRNGWLASRANDSLSQVGPEFLAEPSVKSCFEISFASANEQSLAIPACFCFSTAEGSVVSGFRLPDGDDSTLDNGRRLRSVPTCCKETAGRGVTKKFWMKPGGVVWPFGCFWLLVLLHLSILPARSGWKVGRVLWTA
jgi:hypothetical protein